MFSFDGNSYAGKLAGKVRVDGSSTVFPITEAVAEEFQKKHRKVRVTVGISGTGGGFKKFTTGQTDINDASRPIKSSEKEKAAKNGIEYLVIPVAYDGLSVVINPKNNFVDHLTVTELRKICQPGSIVKTWSDVRPGWPMRILNFTALELTLVLLITLLNLSTASQKLPVQTSLPAKTIMFS